MRGACARAVALALGVVSLNCSPAQTDAGAVDFVVTPANLSLGVAVADIAVSPNGARIWVSARTQGQVKEIDKATRAVVRIITTSGAPRGVAISPLDGTAVVANDSGWVDVIKP